MIWKFIVKIIIRIIIRQLACPIISHFYSVIVRTWKSARFRMPVRYSTGRTWVFYLTAVCKTVIVTLAETVWASLTRTSCFTKGFDLFVWDHSSFYSCMISPKIHFFGIDVSETEFKISKGTIYKYEQIPSHDRSGYDYLAVLTAADYDEIRMTIGICMTYTVVSRYFSSLFLSMCYQDYLLNEAISSLKPECTEFWLLLNSDKATLPL